MKKLALVIASIPFFASAGLFQITCTNGTGLGVCAVEGQNIMNQIADEVNKKLPSADTKDQYLQGMSTAAAMSAAGVTTSYGTVFNHFLIGLTASGAADLGNRNFTDFSGLTKNPEQFRGFGLQAAIVAGVNLGNLIGSEGGVFDLSRLDLYASGFALNHKFGKVNADYLGFGFGGQYKLLRGTKWTPLIRWTGLDVGANILYSKLKIDADVPLDNTYTTTNTGVTYTTNYSGSANFKADIGTIALPIDVSTGIRFFYFLKVVGGVGLDFNLGNLKASGDISNTTVSASDGGANTVNGDATFDINGTSIPKLVNARVFLGPNFEFGIGSFFVTLQKSLLENAIAVNSGLNFFW